MAATQPTRLRKSTASKLKTCSINSSKSKKKSVSWQTKPRNWYSLFPLMCSDEMDRHVNRLNLEIKRLEEDGQIIPLPNANPPQPETNGTATPNETVTNGNQPASQTTNVVQRTPAVRVPSTGPTLVPSQSSTPTPRDKKRKANTAFRRDPAVDEVTADEDSTVYCFCQQVSFGEMVACDNEACEREWFHL